MMTHLLCDVLKALEGKALVSAESCTGGGIGAALTSVPGSSKVYKGGVICYSNWVKENILGVSGDLLSRNGAVSEPVARAMATGVRKLLQADVAISVTGLAGPDGDEFGREVGTVYIGFDSHGITEVRCFCFSGDRESVRQQAVRAALEMILELVKEK